MTAITKSQLRVIVQNSPTNADLNHLDVSLTKNSVNSLASTMSSMFYSSQFTGDISKWDVGNVTDVRSSFANSQFNGDISKWSVIKVTDMSWMFQNSQFTGDISKWNVGKVTDMKRMFKKIETRKF